MNLGKASLSPRPGRPCRLGHGLSLLLSGTPVNFTLSHVGDTLLGGFTGNGDVQIPIDLVSASETKFPTLTSERPCSVQAASGKWQAGPGQVEGTPR